MTYLPPATGANSPARSPAPRDAAPAWPVLARLPLVEDSPAPRGKVTADYDIPHAVPPNESTSRRRDAAHAYESSTGISPEISPASETRDPAPAARRYRVDPARAPHSPPTPLMAHSPSLLDEAEPFAARFLRWHAALAPYSGLAATMALVCSAGLLYWIAFDPRPVVPAPQAAQAPLWPAEHAAPLTLNANDWSSPAPPEDLSPFRWSARPMPKPIPATLEPAPSQATTPNTLATSTPPASPPPAEATVAISPSATPANPATIKAKPAAPAKIVEAPPSVPQPAPPAVQAITPTPTGGAYPATPYSTFDYESLRQALEATGPQPSQPAVAVESPGSDANSSQQPR